MKQNALYKLSHDAPKSLKVHPRGVARCAKRVPRAVADVIEWKLTG